MHVLSFMEMAVKQVGIKRGFSPNLGWSHYRALMNVEHQNERLFYEIEAEAEGWEVKHLERQIHTFLFARLLKSRDKGAVLELARQGQSPDILYSTTTNSFSHRNTCSICLPRKSCGGSWSGNED